MSQAVAGIEQGEQHPTPPKEIEIAIEVFNKGEDYNPLNDSSVRVYISNLRKKLATYYALEGKDETFHISIPPGSYGLTFTPVIDEKDNKLTSEETTTEQPTSAVKASKIKPNKLMQLVALVLVLISIVLNVYLFTQLQEQPKHINRTVQAHPLWQDLQNNGKPTLIVLGDLFVYREKDANNKNDRLVRSFYINNKEDLIRYVQSSPEKSQLIAKAGRKILPKSSFFVLRELLPLFDSKSQFEVKLASEISSQDIAQSNLIYIGLNRSMGILKSYTQHSNFNHNGKTLFNKTSGEQYNVSGEFLREYTDYGLFSKFSGPADNVIYLISGFTDSSIMLMAKTLTQTSFLADLTAKHTNQDFDADNHFEILFEVDSFNHTDLNSSMLFSGGKNTE
ncbi:hypothetical protein [Paraglaciecola sp. L3A3]|uniref:hypothetical protein n=1 Tax=Paraglaciecola sp. L3A3 TaxID=2686358 RepID=UPI00131B94C2|nr:hypothetical protein [Paraglaciecola sp. L3A3]